MSARINVWQFLFSFIAGVSLIFAYSCKPKMVCTAYQSQFILDKEVADQTFSLFGKDSMPKGAGGERKDGHGIMAKMTKKSYQNIHYQVPMVVVYPSRPDTSKGKKTEEPIDTTTVSP